MKRSRCKLQLSVLALLVYEEDLLREASPDEDFGLGSGGRGKARRAAESSAKGRGRGRVLLPHIDLGD